MNATDARKLNIIIVDYISEKNRGDAAIHLGLIKIIKESFPNANLSAVSIFGANQFSAMEDQFDQSKGCGISVFGGLLPTFYPESKNEHKSAVLFEIQNLVGLFCMSWFLVALSAKVPVQILRKCIPQNEKHTFDLIRNADLVIIRGRNYRDRKTTLLEIIRILSKTYHLLVCSLLSKKIVLVGASVWEQKSDLAGKLLAEAFKSCELVTVREKWSVQTAKKLSVIHDFPEPILMPDLSFAAFDQREKLILNRVNLPQSQHPRAIGITIHDWSNDGVEIRGRYIHSITGLVQYYSSLGTRIKIIPQVSVFWEDSSKLLSEILKHAETQNIEIIEGDFSVNQLLELYSELDMLIATRMHSAIFAAAVNTPIVAIAYDKGGKWGIIEELGYGDYLVNYDKITPQVLIEKTCSCWQRKDTLVKEAELAITKNTVALQSLVSLLQKIYFRQ